MMTLFFKTVIVYVGFIADVLKFSAVNVLRGSKSIFGSREMDVLENLARMMPLASSHIFSLPAVVLVTLFFTGRVYSKVDTF